MLKAKLKFTNVPFLCGGDVYIKEEMQDPDMLFCSPDVPEVTPFHTGLSREGNL